jgi:hypothetical protein
MDSKVNLLNWRVRPRASQEFRFRDGFTRAFEEGHEDVEAPIAERNRPIVLE